MKDRKSPATEYENKKCATCRHWFKVFDANNLKNPTGECRRFPVQSTNIPGQGGQIMKVTGYPQPAAACNACGEHEERIALVVASEKDDA